MKKSKPVAVVFFLGLTAGILIPNFVAKSSVRMNGLSDILLLKRYLEEPLSGRAYFLYLLRERSWGYALGAVFGISIFGVPMSLVWMGAMGFYVGFLLTSTLIAGGLSGLALGMGLLLPQYLLYIPAAMFLFGSVYRMSAGCWRNRTYSWRDYRRYFLRITLLFLLILAGILTESFLNPPLVRFLLRRLKIF